MPTAALLNEPMIRCDPVCRIQLAGPQRIQAGVENECRVAAGEIADRAGHRLRMDAVLAAREVGLLVQHLVPLRGVRG